MIEIIDFGSQLTHNIARRVRELGVFTEIIPSAQAIATEGLDGLVLSGGQFSVYDKGSPTIDKKMLQTGAPILGICYGQQLLAHLLGGSVKPTDKREYGTTKIIIERESPLFGDIAEGELNVFMSHADIVKEVPPGFEVVARSEQGHVAAMQDLKRQIFAVQFHPEVDHTQHGRKMLENFVDYTGAEKGWHPGDQIQEMIDDMKSKVGEGIAIAGVSGGVDSTTLAALMQRALKDRFYAIFVNNGLLRKHEEREVAANLAGLGIPFFYADASALFLDRLAGITEPDEKRKIIGNTFIEVFEEHASRLQDVAYLGQGTLYPDVIESVPAYGASAKIKRHHNVGGLPEHMNLGLIEPFRYLFKDEVRQVARSLGLPETIIGRHPFPGPGLAVRIIGDVTSEKLAIVRDADAIFIEELQRQAHYDKIAQAYAALLPGRAVGVMGDGHSYSGMISLRAVTTGDFMTANVYPFPDRDLQKICNRIVNEVTGVGRVFYDRTEKPPGTIELE